MCGRYNIIDDPASRALLEILGIPFRLVDRYNIAPTESVPVVIQDTNGERVIHEMRWWLTPSWAPEMSTRYSMFNARAETVNSSRAFKGPFRHHRGIMPASSFIEWQATARGKQPFLIKPESGRIAFAAIWDVWDRPEAYIESCSLITTAAVEGLEWLHKRMPLMLADDQIDLWLDHQAEIREVLPLLKPGLPEDLLAYPIASRVNNARHKDRELLEPLGEARRISR